MWPMPRMAKLVTEAVGVWTINWSKGSGLTADGERCFLSGIASPCQVFHVGNRPLELDNCPWEVRPRHSEIVAELTG